MIGKQGILCFLFILGIIPISANTNYTLTVTIENNDGTTKVLTGEAAIGCVLTDEGRWLDADMFITGVTSAEVIMTSMSSLPMEIIKECSDGRAETVVRLEILKSKIVKRIDEAIRQAVGGEEDED